MLLVEAKKSYQYKIDKKISSIDTQINFLQEKKTELEQKSQIKMQENKEVENEIRLHKDNLEKLDKDSSASIKLSVMKNLNAGHVDIKNVSKALIALHNEDAANEEMTNAEMIKEFLILSLNSGSDDISAFKTNYEENLSTLDKGDLLKFNKVQCYTGTMFFTILNELNDKPFSNTVVILTDGHILPGYILKNSDKFTLHGIETTAGGKATLNYGETQFIGGEIRVFDAKQFLVVELLKGDIENFEEIYTQMLKTMEHYGFKTENFKPAISSNRHDETSITDLTPFGFGTIDFAESDRTRESFDEKDIKDFQMTPAI